MPCEPRGFSFLGIPIYENACAANNRRNDRRDANTDRLDIKKSADVAKKVSDNERKSTNVYNRNQQQLGSSIARSYGTGDGGFVDQGFDFLTSAVAGGNQVASDVFGSGGAGSTLAGAYLTGGTSLLGGLFGGGTDPATGLPTSSPLVPLAIVALGAGLAYAATR